MPFRSLNDLLYLIEEALPRQARVVMAKANAWLEGHAERKQDDRQVVLNETYVDRVVQAMTEIEYSSDSDDLQAKKKAWLPRFMLRH